MNKDFNICNAKIAEDLLASGKTKVYMLNTNWRMLDEFVEKRYNDLVKNKKVMSSLEFIKYFEEDINTLIIDCGTLLKRKLNNNGSVDSYTSFNDVTLKGYELDAHNFIDHYRSSCFKELWGLSYKRIWKLLTKNITKKYNSLRYTREITIQMPLYELNWDLQYLKKYSAPSWNDKENGVNIRCITSYNKFITKLYNSQDLRLVDIIEKICKNKNYIELASIEHCSNKPIKIIDVSHIDIELIYLHDNMTNKASKLNVYFMYNREAIKLSKIYNYYVPCKITMRGNELLSITPDNEGKVTF